MFKKIEAKQIIKKGEIESEWLFFLLFSILFFL